MTNKCKQCRYWRPHQGPASGTGWCRKLRENTSANSGCLDWSDGDKPPRASGRRRGGPVRVVGRVAGLIAWLVLSASTAGTAAAAAGPDGSRVTGHAADGAERPAVTAWIEWNNPETDPQDATLTELAAAIELWATVTDRVVITTHPAQVTTAYPKLAARLPPGMKIIGGVKGGTGYLWGTNPSKLDDVAAWVKAAAVVSSLLEQPGVDPDLVWLDMEGAFKSITTGQTWAHPACIARLAGEYLPPGTYAVYPTFLASNPDYRDRQLDIVRAFGQGLGGRMAVVENASLWKPRERIHPARDIDLALAEGIRAQYGAGTCGGAAGPIYRIVYTHGDDGHWDYDELPVAVELFVSEHGTDGSVLVFYPHITYALEGSRAAVEVLAAMGWGRP